METTSTPAVEQQPASGAGRRLYRSNQDRVFAGISGGLGEYFAIDPVWFRVGFVILAIGGGSGFLIYLLMWLLIPKAPSGYEAPSAGKASVSGLAVVGAVFVIVGTIALINTISPWMGQYVWPIIFLVGGLALIVGGLNRDRDR